MCHQSHLKIKQDRLECGWQLWSSFISGCSSITSRLRRLQIRGEGYTCVEQLCCCRTTQQLSSMPGMHLWFEYLLSHWMLWFFPPACMSCGDLQTGGRNQCVAGEWAFYTSRIVDYLWRLGRSKLLVTVLQILLLYFAHPYRITLNDYKNVIL